jgi:DNA polymerase III sliding clamp (beta) subunit (PCNA family)
MKLTIKTTLFQDMLTRALKGSSNNKLIPLTGLMAIQLQNNELTVITTDATNYLYVKENKVAGEDFYVVVQTETISKLIAKTTSENVTLELLENKLEISGNGKYSIELPLDENGQLIKYPDPVKSFNLKDRDPKEINLTTIRAILTTAKAALATTLEVPCYTGYYVGNKVIATDTYKICGMDMKLIDTPKLISPEMMDLLNVMKAEKIQFYVLEDNKLVFVSEDCVVYGTTLDGIEDYAVDAIDGLLTEPFESMCKLPKDALLQLLERLALFVGNYDKNGIYLTFTKDGMMVSSKQSNGTEIIAYKESKNFTDYTCCIDIEMLQTQVKAQTADVIEMWYGKDNAIKMVDGNVTQIVALLEDDRLEE